MAVVIGKSLAITNRDAIPRVKNDSYFEHGSVKEIIGYCAVANGDDIGSTYLIGSIPSNCRVSTVEVACSAITSAAADIGVQDTTANGSGAVASTNGVKCFASAQSLASALTGTNVTNESALSGISDLPSVEQQLWQALGFASDPCKDFDVVATLTVAATAAGKLVIKVRYCV